MAPKLTLHATRSGVLALSLLIWPTLAWPTPVSTTPIDIPGQFPDATLSNWKERSFAGNTKYRLVEEDGVNVLPTHRAARRSSIASVKSISADFRYSNGPGKWRRCIP